MSKLSKYKNIVNKSRDLNKQDPYDLFVKSLPSELDYYKNGDNYRLKAAWAAYGKPKDATEALFNGMIDFFGETPKMASIGYNDETDSYEYLYSGKDNDNVNRDIRVWDNDVIPFVKELKNGGYIRTFDEELNCWMYLKGGKTKPFRLRKYKTYEELKTYLGDRASEEDYDLLSAYNDDAVYFAWEDEESKNPGNGHWPDTYKLPNHPTFSKDSKYSTPYGVWEGGEWSKDLSGKWTFKTSPWIESQHSLENLQKYLSNNELNPMILIYSGKNYEIIPNFTPQAFKQGGQMNVIPEGALHAHKNHMEGAGKDFTMKGIPVMDNDGNQVAEVEREELILNKENTDKIEDLYKKFYSDNLTEQEKDELAIKAGKRLAKELIENVDDRVGLIDKIDNGN